MAGGENGRYTTIDYTNEYYTQSIKIESGKTNVLDNFVICEGIKNLENTLEEWEENLILN